MAKSTSEKVLASRSFSRENSGAAIALKEIANSIAEVDREARKAGVSSKVWQQWTYVATATGMSIDGVTDRANAMIAAVPAKLPQNEEYKQTFAMLFNSPIWAAEIARQKVLKG